MAQRKRILGFCQCYIHGRQRSWFVCKHIAKREDVVTTIPWTEQLGGRLCCSFPGEDHTADDINLTCEAHLRVMGILPAA